MHRISDVFERLVLFAVLMVIVGAGARTCSRPAYAVRPVPCEVEVYRLRHENAQLKADLDRIFRELNGGG